MHYLFHGLEAAMPYAHTHVHAKVASAEDAGEGVERFKGTIALEWENGPMDGIEGTRWLMKEVLAAL